ncbi:discoidin domain-containing protein [Cohnella herbarum]|uniref:Uncharacterized protein n=1 Tax=Cohnella herbarum TaxID=2728023 RepID=A0A7Z2ZPI2_9BACL|nr:discoidin domain-containing protein [Cohnella herbarum]QJD87486.1 hypothetical protein HH215_32780 [Cohnella herbarum]
MKPIGKALTCCALAALLFMTSLPVTAVANTENPYLVYWVDPVAGSDQSDGSELAPFRTIAHARDVVSQQVDQMTGNIVIYLRGGNHRIESALEFGPQDSGANGHRVIYAAAPGEEPVITGGQSVNGWTMFDPANNVYVAPVPAGAEGARQFYANGVRANRSMSEESPVDWQWSGSDGYLSQSHDGPDANEWIVVDLGSVVNGVKSVKLYPGSALETGGKAAGFPADFTIELSTDGISYVPAVTVNGYASPESGQAQTFAFSAQSARFVKLNVTKLGASDRLEAGKHRLILAEIEADNADYVYDPNLGKVDRVDFSRNLALMRPVDLSMKDEVGGALPVGNLVDGDLNTFATTVSWTDPNFPQMLTVTLSDTDAVPVSAVRMWPRPDDQGGVVHEPSDFTVEVSPDGENWSSVTSVVYGQWTPNGPMTLTFAPAAAKQLRVNVNKIGHGEENGGQTYYRMQLMELAVYGTANLARGATVEAPNSWEYPQGNLSKNAITDGLLHGSFYTSFSSPSPEMKDAAVTMDLGSARHVGGLRLYPRNDGTNNVHYPAEILIQSSSEGIEYEDILRLSGIPDTNGKPQEFIFDQAVQAKYLRIVPLRIGVGESGNYRFQLMEAEALPPASGSEGPPPAGIASAAGALVKGSAHAMNALATASSSDGDADNGPAKLTDGVTSDSLSKMGYRVPASYGLQNWHNLQNVEVHILRWWYHHIGKIDRVSPDGTNLVMNQAIWDKTEVDNDRPTWIENAYELLDREGEWYLDPNGSVDGSGNAKIYYKPRAGENMAILKTELPKAEQLLKLTGTLDQPVSNLVFAGIVFETSGWTGPNKNGYADAQAGTFVVGPRVEQIPSAVELAYSRNVTLENNVFRNLGSGALRVWKASQDNAVVGNVFHDISAGGLFIGATDDHHAYEADARDVVKNNTVSNNYVTRIGADYYDSVGIFVGYTEGTVVSRNIVREVPYTGISLGWGWGHADAGGLYGYATPTSAKNNRIENNLVAEAGKVQHDGGLIYTLGAQPGSVISGNYVDGYNDGTFDKDAGIYLDEGTVGVEVKNNVVGLAYWWLNMWTPSIKNNHWHDNYYSVDRQRNNGTGNVIENNTHVPDGDFAAVSGAAAIIANAGLQPEYAAIAAKVPDRDVARHQAKLAKYPDSHAYYFANNRGVKNVSITGQISEPVIDWINRTARLTVPESTNLSALSPVFTLENGYSVTPGAGVPVDFSAGAVPFTVSNGQVVYVWLVNVKKSISGTGPITAPVTTLDSAISSLNVWTALPTQNGDGSITISGNSGYTGGKFGETILAFDMRSALNMEGKDWLGFTLRDQNPYVNFALKPSTTYAINVNHDGWELQKWLNGSREMLIGTVGGMIPRFGNVANTHYSPNERHSIRTGAINVDGGVRIFLFVDGVKVFDVIDNDDPITQEGYFSVYGMTSPVTLLPYTGIEIAGPTDPGNGSGGQTGSPSPSGNRLNGGAAKLEITDAADFLKNNVSVTDGRKILTAEVPGGSETNAGMEMTFPAELANLALQEGVETLRIKSLAGELQIPTGTLVKMAGQGAISITVKVQSVANSELNEQQRRKYPGGRAIEFVVEADGNRAASFDPPIFVIWPDRDSAANSDLASAFRLLDDGTMMNLGGRYDQGDMRFQAIGSGLYVIRQNPVVFKDLSEMHWAYGFISSMAAKGMIQGTGNDRFDPSAVITRSQTAVLLARILGLKEAATPSFADVAADSGYAGAVNALAEAGIVTGSNGHFDPDAEINRQDLAVLISRAISYSGGTVSVSNGRAFTYADQSLIASYAREAVSWMSELGIMQGTGENRFNPTGRASRAEMAKIAYLLLNRTTNGGEELRQ